MFDKDAVNALFKQIAELHVQPKVAEIDGVPYLIERGKDPRDMRVRVATLHSVTFHSLDGLVAYRKQLELDGHCYHVMSPTVVALLTKNRLSDNTVKFHESPAQAVKSQCAAIGNFMSQEQMMIWAGANLADGPEKVEFLRIVGGLTAASVREVTGKDGGVMQEVTLSAKVSLNSVASVKPIWTLRPNRTFRDIEQPESKFLLRLRGQEGAVPQVAIFEADGGSWELDAYHNIKEFIEANDEGAIVIF